MDVRNEFELMFPHQGEDVGQLQAVETKFVETISWDQKVSDFQNRFPWLKFADNSNKKLYYYQGRETEHQSPYYVRFDLRSCESDNQLDKQKRNISQKFAQFMKNGFRQSWECQKFADQLKEQYEQVCTFAKGQQFASAIVNHGFIFTGLAKTTITANQIFDLLFLGPVDGMKKEQNKSRIDSKMDKQRVVDKKSHHIALDGYTNIRKSWQFKRNSFQYIKFMCKAFIETKDKIQKLLSNENKQINNQVSIQDRKKQLIYAQLFNEYSYRTIFYKSAINQQRQINDKEYFCYFYSLISENCNIILQQMSRYQIGKKQNKEDNQYKDLLINLNHNIHLCLTSYDYQSYVQTIFKGENLNIGQISNIIKHYQSYYQAILSDFKFTISHEKVAKLKKLQRITTNTNHKISLVQLISSKDNPKIEYMLVLYRPQQIVSCQFYQLSEFINKRKFDHYFQQSVKDKFTTVDHVISSYAQSVGINDKIQIQYFINNSLKSQFYKYFSYSPTNLSFAQQNLKFKSSFQHAMCKYLNLTQIPLTLQQKLLFNTPQGTVNVYDMIQKIINQIEDIQQKWDLHQQKYTTEDKIKLDLICSNLNNQFQETGKKSYQANKSNKSMIFKVNPISNREEDQSKYTQGVEQSKLSLRDKICVLFTLFIDQQIKYKKPVALNRQGQQYQIINHRQINQLQQRIFELLVRLKILNSIVMEETGYIHEKQLLEKSMYNQYGSNMGVTTDNKQQNQAYYKIKKDPQQKAMREDIIDYFNYRASHSYKKGYNNYLNIEIRDIDERIKSLFKVSKSLQYSVASTSGPVQIQANIRKCLGFNCFLLKRTILLKRRNKQSLINLNRELKKQWQQAPKIKRQEKKRIPVDSDKLRKEKINQVKQFYNQLRLDDILNDEGQKYVEYFKANDHEHKIRKYQVFLFWDTYEKIQQNSVEMSQQFTYQLFLLFLFSSPHSRSKDICQYYNQFFSLCFNAQRYQFKNCQYKRIFTRQALQLAKLTTSNSG